MSTSNVVKSLDGRGCAPDPQPAGEVIALPHTLWLVGRRWLLPS